MHACMHLVGSVIQVHAFINLVYMHVCYTPYVSLTKINNYTHNVGVKEYCFVSNGLCCVPPFEDFPPTPVEAYTLKLSDQFSTSVKFYSAGGARGNLRSICCT